MAPIIFRTGVAFQKTTGFIFLNNFEKKKEKNCIDKFFFFIIFKLKIKSQHFTISRTTFLLEVAEGVKHLHKKRFFIINDYQTNAQFD